jgi:hypothetical protein
MDNLGLNGTQVTNVFCEYFEIVKMMQIQSGKLEKQFAVSV